MIKLVRNCLILISLSCVLAACGSVSKIDPKLGVAPSPRVTTKSNIPSGGGRYHVGKPYKIAGRWYRPREVSSYEKTGMASWYGDKFHGRKTANGETYNMNALSAAHPTLPLPSYVRVTNVANNRSVIVRVNDRGPFARNRIIDVSKRAADVLGLRQAGVGKVHVSYVGKAPLEGGDEAFLMASISDRGRNAPLPQQIMPSRHLTLAQVPSAQISAPQLSSIPHAQALNRSVSTGAAELLRMAHRKNGMATGGPLLIWGDAIPPVGVGYVNHPSQ